MTPPYARTLHIRACTRARIGLVVAGFIPNTMGGITEYFPTLPETMITVGVYGIGFLILTGLYKIAITVREEIDVL